MFTAQALIVDVLRRRRRATVSGAVAASVHQICEALVPVAIGVAVELAVDGARPLAILLAVAGILALFVVLGAGGGIANWTLTAASLREAHELRVRAVAQLLGDPDTGHGRATGELMSILTSDTRATAEVIRVVTNLVSGCAGLAVTVVVLLRVDLWLGIGILVVVPALMFGIDRIGPWLERRVRASQQAGGLAAALAAELVQALRPLRGFGGVPEAVRRYRGVSRRSLRAALDTTTASAVVEGAGLLATGLVLIGTAAAAGALALSGRITIGAFVTVVAMAAFVGDPVSRIAAAVTQSAVSRASAARVAALLPTVVRPAGGATVERLGPLRVQEVTVGPVRGLDFTLGPTELLGIVTTGPDLADAVTDLLAGREPPEAGRVFFGAVPVDSLEPYRVRRQVLVEPHTAHLFGATLDAALDTGRGTGPATTARALAAAGAGDVPTELLDGGANLSGGQRQRVALARAMAAGPPVLVLRDPLTAVDAVTEDAVAEGLKALRHKDGATIVVTTSPPLLSRCDRVIFLDRDRSPVVATHAQLSADPAYAGAVLR
jgi:putative ABC transport system ATP-binding protein